MERACPCKILILSFLAELTRASTISAALSDCGKTRFPLSVLSGTPAVSKKSIVSAEEKEEKAEYKNLPFFGVLAISVSKSQLLVTLHLPLPVIISFLPHRSFFSMTETLLPFLAAVTAAIRPAAPPPITTVLFIKFYIPYIFGGFQGFSKEIYRPPMSYSYGACPP